MADQVILNGSAINELVARLRGALEPHNPTGTSFILVMSPWTLKALRGTWDDVTLRPLVEFRFQGGCALQGHHIYLHDDLPQGEIVMNTLEQPVNGAYPT